MNTLFSSIALSIFLVASPAFGQEIQAPLANAPQEVRFDWCTEYVYRVQKEENRIGLPPEAMDIHFRNDRDECTVDPQRYLREHPLRG